MLQLQAGCLFSFWLTALIWMLQCINKKINSLYHKVGHVIYLFDKKPSASAVHSLLSPLVNSCKVWTKEKKNKYQDEKKNSYPKWDNRSKFIYTCPQWDNSIWNQTVFKIQTLVCPILNILHKKNSVSSFIFSVCFLPIEILLWIDCDDATFWKDSPMNRAAY